MVRSSHIIATPPGATIKEQLDDRGMTQKEFSSRMGMTEKHISKLINGEVALTQETAMKLEFVLGIPMNYWINLETIYRQKLLKAEEENQMDEDLKLVSKFPYNEMARFNWVSDTKKKEERVFSLRRFFEVTKLEMVFDENTPVACRRMAETEKGDIALISWTQKAKLEARNIDVDLIDIQKLRSYIPEIRKMTTETPEIFCNDLKKILSECGIAIVFLPSIGGSFLHGATFIDNKKIVLGMTVRGKDADIFWFSLFHEIGHIILGHVFNNRTTTTEEEREADKFARDTLISMTDFSDFIQKNNGHYTESDIRKFADKIGISTGIVVGRLQKENQIDFSWFNGLKTKYELLS